MNRDGFDGITVSWMGNVLDMFILFPVVSKCACTTCVVSNLERALNLVLKLNRVVCV